MELNMGTFQDLKYKYRALDVFGKIIAINSVVFVLDFILTRLLGFNGFSYFKMPADFGDFILQPWSLLSYGFLHSGFFHLLFNMLFLFYLTRTATNLFRTKMVLNIYLLGIICGGLSYLAVSNLVATNFFGTNNGMLIGASAGVSALLMFIGVYLPDSQIRLFNTFNVRWLHIALFFVALDVFRLLLGINQGGYIAHIGGYILGYYYAKKLTQNRDIGVGFEKAMDTVMGWFTSKSKLKTVHRKQVSKATKVNVRTDNNAKQVAIDTILDKISKSGYESLTAKEKKFLFEASKDD